MCVTRFVSFLTLTKSRGCCTASAFKGEIGKCRSEPCVAETGLVVELAYGVGRGNYKLVAGRSCWSLVDKRNPREAELPEGLLFHQRPARATSDQLVDCRLERHTRRA